MTNLDIAHQRLHNQHITQRTFEKPGAVVEWLGAVQAQDYAAATWALGLRLPGMTSDAIEHAFAGGAILRTHLMRPTWHFVSPADIRWILALTAPRVNAANAHWYRRLELDDALFRLSNAALANALQGGKQLTRPELLSVLKLAGIATDDTFRFTYIMMRAELDGIVCSGARRGRLNSSETTPPSIPTTPATAPVAAAAAANDAEVRLCATVTGEGLVWDGIEAACCTPSRLRNSAITADNSDDFTPALSHTPAPSYGVLWRLAIAR